MSRSTVRRLTPSIRAASNLLKASASGVLSRTDVSEAIVVPPCSWAVARHISPLLEAVGVYCVQNNLTERSGLRHVGLILCWQVPITAVYWIVRTPCRAPSELPYV